MQDKIKALLNFRKQFTKREWFEINQIIETRFNEKADQLVLDDSDLKIISDRLKRIIR